MTHRLLKLHPLRSGAHETVTHRFLEWAVVYSRNKQLNCGAAVESVGSKRTRHAANVLGFVLAAFASASMVNAQPLTGTVTVDISRGPIADFVPDQAFGAALDGHEEGETTSI
jgi:hypothetical protein